MMALTNTMPSSRRTNETIGVIWLDAAPRRCARIAALACVMAAIGHHTLVPPAAGDGQAWRWAQLGDITLTLDVLVDDATISACEPVVARIVWTNSGDDYVSILPGSDSGRSTWLRITRPDGEVISAMPRPRPLPGLRCLSVGGPWSLAPGGTTEEVWVVSGWYQFDEPGDYVILLQQLDLTQEALPVLAETSTSLRVVAFDGTRLERRCEEVFGPLRTGRPSVTPVPISARVKALLSVRHDVVLPYLDWVATEWGEYYSCQAMRRIGSERADELLRTLATREDRVGEAARRALEDPLREISPWDVIP